MTVAKFWTNTLSEIKITPPQTGGPGGGSGSGGGNGGGGRPGGGGGFGNGNGNNGGGGRGNGKGPGGNNSGGGGGSFLSYAYNGVEPVYVADYTNGVYGFGAGGATAPTLSTNPSNLFLSGSSGRLSTAAEAVVDNLRSACTFVLWGTWANPVVSGETLYDLNDGTLNNQNTGALAFSLSQVRARLSLRSAGSGQGTPQVSVNGLGGQAYKWAGRAALNDLAVYYNGTLAQTDTSANIPASAFTGAAIGNETGGLTPYTGTFSLVVAFPSALDNTGMAEVTNDTWEPV